jgi:hypothetical protein
MRVEQLFPSNYLRAVDLNGDKVVTITGLAKQMFDDGEKVIVNFEGEKGLVLNVTNGKTIAKLHGDETDLWTGKKITLYATEVEYRGEMKLGIRVRASAPPQESSAPLGATLTVDQINGLKELYQKHKWPVDQVARLVKEICNVDSLAAIPQVHLAVLREYFGRDWTANFDPDATSNEKPLESDDIPF